MIPNTIKDLSKKGIKVYLMHILYGVSLLVYQYREVSGKGGEKPLKFQSFQSGRLITVKGVSHAYTAVSLNMIV